MEDSIAASIEALHISNTDETIAKRAHYSPPWADVSIIGLAGSSGSGKSTLSQAIVRKLNLPWVVILSIVSLKWWQCLCKGEHLIQGPQDSFYKSLDAESSRKAFRNEYDFDSPEVSRDPRRANRSSELIVAPGYGFRRISRTSPGSQGWVSRCAMKKVPIRLCSSCRLSRPHTQQ